MEIMLIDDNADIRLLLKRTLELAGYAVREAAGGGEALASLRGSPLPDLILLDVQMPDIDGWATLEAIRADPRSAQIPVVMCTVKAGWPDQARGWELGCDGYVRKPFDVRELEREIGRTLARAPADRDRFRRDRLAAAREERAAAG